MAVLLLLFVASVFLIKCYIEQRPAGPSDYYPAPGGPWFCIKRFIYLKLFPYFPQKNESYRALLGRGIRETPDDPSGFARVLEEPQKLADSPYAIDSVYFTAFTEDGKSFIITRVARRAEGRCAVWLFMRLDGVGDFEHQEHPNTIMPCEGDSSWSAGGLTVMRLEPYKTWRISFDGPLRKGPFRCSVSEDIGEIVHVKFTMNWTNSTDVFDFAHDLHPNLIADVLAMGPLSMEFLSALRKANEEHDRYEQWGNLQANVSIQSDPEHRMSMSGIRSHSYGVRNWEDFHRYVMFLIHFENGASVHLNIISLKMHNRHSIVGYVFFPDGKQAGIEWSDAHLSTLAEDRIINYNYEIHFTAGGQTFNVTATLDPKSSPIIHNPSFNNSRTPNAGITLECIASFRMGNGTRGRGLVEFFYEYNNAATSGHCLHCS